MISYFDEDYPTFEEDEKQILSKAPDLDFTPYAWAKLNRFQNKSDTEVACFGISDLDNLFLVKDLYFPKQQCTAASFKLDDDDVSCYFDDMVDEGLEPCQFFRILIHTHPGDDPTPSQIDEDTFDKILQGQDWNIMCILASNGNEYSRFNIDFMGRKIQLNQKIMINYGVEFIGSNFKLWDEERKKNITKMVLKNKTIFSKKGFKNTKSRQLSVPHGVGY